MVKPLSSIKKKKKLQKLRAKHNSDKFQNYLGERSIFGMKRNIGTVHVLAMEHLYVMLMMMMDKKN